MAVSSGNITEGLNKSESFSNKSIIKAEIGKRNRKVPLITGSMLRQNFLGKWGFKYVEHSGGIYKTGNTLGYHCETVSGYVMLSCGGNHYHLQQKPTLTKSTTITDVNPGVEVEWQILPNLASKPDQSGTEFIGIYDDKDDSGDLYWVARANYPVSSIDHPTQAAIDSSGTYGYYRVQGIHHNQVGGAIAKPPSDLSGDYLTTFCNGNGVTNYGPHLSLITLNKSLNSGEYLSGTKILDYSESNPVGYTNRVTFCRGVAWIENTKYQGVLFGVTQGIGNVWYGDQHDVQESGLENLFLNSAANSLGTLYGIFGHENGTSYDSEFIIYDTEIDRDNALAGGKPYSQTGAICRFASTDENASGTKFVIEQLNLSGVSGEFDITFNPGGLSEDTYFEIWFDKYNSAKGYHSDIYRQEVWIYNPVDLRDVIRGRILSSKPQPTEIVDLTEYEVRDSRNKYVSMSLKNNRLTISLAEGFRPTGQNFEYQPLILEFDFS